MYKILLCLLAFLLYSCAVSSPSSMKSAKKPTTIKSNMDTTATESKNQQPKGKSKSNPKPIDNETKTKKEEDKQTQVTPPKPKIRFEDTTKIEMEPIYALKQSQTNTKSNTKNPIEKEIEFANKLLENGELDKAKEKFSILVATLPYGDSLYYEAKFGEIECLVAQNNINSAKTLLLELNKDENINSETKEKTLVRLGQIECIQNNQNAAENYFNQLRNEFPRSIYLKVANCNFLKKK